MQGNQETSKDSVIRYTEFEKRIIEKSSNLYKGYYSLPWGGYRLSAWYIGFILVCSLLFLGFCIWNPSVSSIMLLGSWIFLSIHYFLGVLIVQFKVRRRIMLFTALLGDSLAWMLLFSAIFFQARQPPDITTQSIFITLFATMAILSVGPSAYVLIQAYRGKYDKYLNQSIRQQ